MTHSTPKVSVLMPAYNAEQYIEEAIQSILNQTFTDFEFIIIDDCSTDSTREIIQDYVKKDQRIIAIKNEENLKICKTLNKGISLARGDYIARMDADDISRYDRFEKQIEILDHSLNVGIVGGSMQMFNDKGIIGIRKYNLNDDKIRKYIFRYSPFCHPTTMIRKNILDKSGGYNPDLVYAEDYDLYFRIGRYSQFANIDDIVLNYRMFDNNSTSRKLKEMELKTLYIRIKALIEYDYNMTIMDKIYFVLQYLSSLFIRGKLRMWLFNFLRNSSGSKNIKF